MISKIITKFNYYKTLLQSNSIQLEGLSFSKAKRIPIFVYKLHVISDLHGREER